MFESEVARLRAVRAQLDQLIVICASPEIAAAISTLPPAAREAATGAIGRALQHDAQNSAEAFDSTVGVIAHHTDLETAKALFRDLVDEHG
ncbi:MAG: hypothetical protein Q8R16_01560 [bacterium]|nr:hypothetical protein [bacterium]